MGKAYGSHLVTKALKCDGVITTQQAYSLGASKSQLVKMVADGLFERPERGVLRLSGSAKTFNQSLRVAVLRVGQPSAVSHRAAAALWELEGLDSKIVEITVPRSNRFRANTATIHRTTKWWDGDVRWHRGLPVTTPERTLVDVAAQLKETNLEFALDDALRRGLTTTSRVTERCAALAGRGFPGAGKLAALLNTRTFADDRTESALEKRFLQILRRSKIMYPKAQHPIYTPDGAFLMRADFAYPHKMLGIELDSETWHMDRLRFQEDRRKRARAEAIGWRILAFTYTQVTREPQYVSDTVAQALALWGSET